MNDLQITPLTKTIEKVIDYRGKTPKKMGGDWSSYGYRALSALNVKSTGLENLDQVKFLNENLYIKWMKDEVKRGDILLTSEAPAGQVLYWDSDEKIVLSQRLFALRINDKYDAKYITYYIRSNTGQKAIFDKMSGSTVSGISAKMFDLIPVITRSLPVQQKISKVLYTLDSTIELNNKINSELEAMAKTLYDYWFVQFDFPDENGKPYKSSGGKMVWSKELKREIPEEWEVFSLSELLKESKNGDWGKDTANKESIKSYCIRGADINGLNGTDSFDPPIRYIVNSHSDRILKADDLIIEISGGSPTQSTGRMAHISDNVLQRLNEKVVCSNFCKAISIKSNKLSYLICRYWDHLYKSNIFFNYEGKTSGIKNLLFNQVIKDVKIALPKDEKLIDTSYKFEESVDSQKQNNLAQNQKLSQLRDWLLPMLMNGQVRVN